MIFIMCTLYFKGCNFRRRNRVDFFESFADKITKVRRVRPATAQTKIPAAYQRLAHKRT